MDWWNAIILGIVEGVTEFLPISSTGHLTITEKLMGYSVKDPAMTAFTAIIQIGAIVAVIVFFRKDIWQILSAWFRGILNKGARKDLNYRYGWAIIIGSLPIVVVGYLLKDHIGETIRSLWVVAFALIGWSAVMWLADKYSRGIKKEKETTWKDTLVIGMSQCLALIPGVSRSGATISAGLLKGFDRVTVTKLSFFLGIPALVAAGVLESVTQYKSISSGIGWGPTVLATAIAFFTSYFVIAWLLKFVANHNFSLFIWYRVGLGVLLIILLSSNIISAV